LVKVVAQEEERFAIVFCQSIDEAVSKIQASLVAAFAVTIEGLPRQQGLHSIYRNDFDFELSKICVEDIEFPLTSSRQKHHRGFGQRNC
jgi:hypothetical protein